RAPPSVQLASWQRTSSLHRCYASHRVLPSFPPRRSSDLPRAPGEAPDRQYPFWLNTGRGSSAQWHTGSRTNKSAVLRKLAPNERSEEPTSELQSREKLVCRLLLEKKNRHAAEHEGHPATN